MDALDGCVETGGYYRPDLPAQLSLDWAWISPLLAHEAGFATQHTDFGARIYRTR